MLAPRVEPKLDGYGACSGVVEDVAVLVHQLTAEDRELLDAACGGSVLSW
jgi:hypothetical protein